jgi:ATP-binding protein involved in chromosome partitioning
MIGHGFHACIFPRRAREDFPPARLTLAACFFVCPHCHEEIDIFSKGGGQRTAQQFSVPFLGSIELDPEIRKGGDGGHPIVMEGDQSPHAKSLFAFTHKVIERTRELQAADGGSVIEIR